MAAKLAEAILQLRIDDKEYQAALGQIPKDAEKAATAVKGIGQAVDLKIFKELGQAAFNGLKMIVDGIVELGNRGAQVDDVAGSFEVLTAKTGETADVMIGKLRQGVVGTLSDYDLMVLANKTLGSGLVKTADDMGVVAAGARTLAKATGQTTAEAFDTLTSAMASGRTAALKQVGLFVDSKVAVESYAQGIGKSVSELTDADRAQALAAASLTALKQRMKEVVPDAADFGELIEQVEIRLSNFKDQVSVGIAKSPVFATAMRAMGSALNDAFGSDQAGRTRAVVMAIEDVAIGLTYVAQGGVIAGGALVTAFSAAKVVFNATAAAIMTVATGVAAAAEMSYRLNASLPFAGKAVQDLADRATDTRKRMEDLAVAFVENTQEAWKGVNGTSELHQKLDALGGVIMRVRDAMEASRGKTVETTTAVQDLGNAAPVAEARTRESADKIAAAFRDLNAEVVSGTKVGLDKRLFEIEAARVKEIDGLKQLKDMTVAEHADMERLINEKYSQRGIAAILAGDEIKAKEREVQNEIALLTTTGTQNKLIQIEIARQKEIASLAALMVANEAQYTADVAAVNEKYRLQAEAAQGYYATIELAAANAGFKTRAELQVEADNAKRLYQEMLDSGLFTYGELEKAKRKQTEAEEALNEQSKLSSMQKFQVVAESASTILRSIFGKNKNAAIAAAIIDTAAAVTKTLAQYPFPFSLVPAAAAAAAGYAQVKAIRAQGADGFAQGTPGLDFADFGPESWHPLHNQEAVIPRGGGHVLAGEIADSMPAQGEQTSLLREIVGLLRDAPAENRRAFRNAMILDMA